MNPFILGENNLKIEDVCAVANSTVQISVENPSFKAKIDKSYNLLCSLLEKGQQIYGVTTGYGDSCTTSVDPHLLEQLPENLVNYHGCGLGDYFNEEESRAIQIARLASLTQGASGVRFELLQFLSQQINLRISPRIPKEGSVGASGDLTPLSYLAATCLGQGEVYYKGQIHSAENLFQTLNIKAPGLKPKEGLAIMNGTAVMTGLACLAFERASNLCKLASKITAANSVALLGNPTHFDDFLFASKPHVGQRQIATWIRSEFSPSFLKAKQSRLQDRYSIRCAPHVIGVLQDALNFFRTLIETELNSANDNPLIDVEREQVVHGGNFYGGHIAFAMDSMKVLIANVADLLDRQLALLVDPKFNNGLPANLSGAKTDSQLHHGFKAVQIAASAWTAETLKLSLPASIFSRSTECHNQDKVSMGTISARYCLRALELTEQVTAASLFASAQALELRQRAKELSPDDIGSSLLKFKNSVLEQAPFVEKDRRLEKDLRLLVSNTQKNIWGLYP